MVRGKQNLQNICEELSKKEYVDVPVIDSYETPDGFKAEKAIFIYLPLDENNNPKQGCDKKVKDFFRKKSRGIEVIEAEEYEGQILIAYQPIKIEE